jgi:hypothetical protein
VPSDWTTIILWVIGAALAMWLVQLALHQHLQGLVLLLTESDDLATLSHFLLLSPGIVAHELSHWLAATVLGVRVGPISIGPQRKRGKQMRFGSVQIARTDAVRESLIGLAPLISGTALVLLIARWAFGLLPAASPNPTQWPGTLLSCLQAPDAWLWLYLIFAVANAMLPSVSDRRAWSTFVLYLALIAVVAYATVGIPSGSEVWLGWGLRLLSYLAYAFTLTTFVDMGVVSLVLLVEWLVGRLTGRRVEYGP